MKINRKISKRKFIREASIGALGFSIIPSHVLGGQGKTPPSAKLNVACIGLNGRGGASLNGVKEENIVALCDVNMKGAANIFKKYPKAKQYQDFREMFDKQEKEIDAVTIATPDHTHAVAGMAALRRGKHLFCEKPLAHSIYETRSLMKAANEHKVVTQLGNQGHSSDHIRLFCEWIWDGAIGNVKEIHASCDAFQNVYSQIKNLPRRNEKHDIPAGLDWDLWLGPAQMRPYNPMYQPFNWRGWSPYGCGVIGDWICHVVDPSFWALDLGAPRTVQAQAEGYDPKKHADTFPRGTEITFEFPAKGKRGPVKLVWYDGNCKAPRPPELEAGRKIPGTGAIVRGDKGVIMHGSHGAGGVRIIPEVEMKAYKRPSQSIPRVKGHHHDWLQAIKSGKQAGSGFNYGGPLTEIALLGVIATRMLGQKLEWDSAKTRFTNNTEANQYINPSFRAGWTL